MGNKFLKYEDVLLSVQNTPVFASSVQIGVQGSVEPVHLINGQLLRYCANDGLKGTININYLLTGANPSYFNITGSTEDPVAITFNNVSVSGYISSLNLSVKPFSPVEASVSFDFFGPFAALAQDSASYSSNSMRNAAKIGYAAKTVLGGVTNLGINNTMAFSYSASASRSPHYLVGYTTPFRVSKQNVVVQMTINGENIGNYLDVTGNSAYLTASIYDIYDGSTILDTFTCSGQVVGQDLSVSQGGYLNGTLNVRQEFLTGTPLI
jgi:hypothetical protein